MAEPWALWSPCVPSELITFPSACVPLNSSIFRVRIDRLHVAQTGLRLSTVVGPPSASAIICPQ